MWWMSDDTPGTTSLQARLAGLGIAAALGMGVLVAAPTPALAEDDPSTPAEPVEQAEQVVAGEQDDATTPDTDAAGSSDSGDGEGASAEQGDDDAATQGGGDASTEQGTDDTSADQGDGNATTPAGGQVAEPEGEPAPAASSLPSDEPASSPTDPDPSSELSNPNQETDVAAGQECVRAATAQATEAAAGATQPRKSMQRAAEDDPTPDTDQPQDEPEPDYPTDGWWTDPNDPSITYFFKKGKKVRGWVVTPLAVGTNKEGATKRYWLDSTYILARDRMVNPAKANDNLKHSYLAYARKDGSIATGSFRVGDRIYLANSNGKLATLKNGKRRGWLVSDTYAGVERRYYLYKSTSGSDKGAYYAVRGFSRDGYAHYTLPKGYVLTRTRRVKGRIYLATSEGRIGATKKDVKRGWLVTSAFSKDGSQRRYYLYRDTDGSYQGSYYAKPGYSKDGYRHLTRTNGSVVCGPFRLNGKIFLASEKGKLGSPEKGGKRGWLVSSAFGQGKQRYYLYRSTSGITKGAYYAKPGYSKDGYRHLTKKDGSVVCGLYRVKDKIFLASEKGRLGVPKGGGK